MESKKLDKRMGGFFLRDSGFVQQKFPPDPPRIGEFRKQWWLFTFFTIHKVLIFNVGGQVKLNVIPYLTDRS